jgi:glycine cleavage system H protein
LSLKEDVVAKTDECILEATVDKFTFRVPASLLFNDAGVWVARDGTRARLGISDFVQQINGDIAFANVRPPGAELSIGDEFASIETVKATLELPSPVAGKIIEINPKLQASPELINQDPYGAGWMAVIHLKDTPEVVTGLIDALRYLDLIKTQAETELNH